METPYFFGLVRKGTSGCRWGRRKRLRVFRGRSRKFDFTHVLFCCKKRAKINGENDGRSVRSAGSKLHPGVRRARVPCVLLFSAGRWFSLGRAPCGVTCFSKVNELGAWGKRQGRRNKPQPAARRLTGACPRREKAERSGRLALSLMSLAFRS